MASEQFQSISLISSHSLQSVSRKPAHYQALVHRASDNQDTSLESANASFNPTQFPSTTTTTTPVSNRSEDQKPTLGHARTTSVVDRNPSAGSWAVETSVPARSSLVEDRLQPTADRMGGMAAFPSLKQFEQ